MSVFRGISCEFGVVGIRGTVREVTDFRALPDLWLIVRVGFDRFSECNQGICACES